MVLTKTPLVGHHSSPIVSVCVDRSHAFSKSVETSIIYQVGPCSSEDRALASGARCKGSSPFRGSYFVPRRLSLWVKF